VAPDRRRRKHPKPGDRGHRPPRPTTQVQLRRDPDSGGWQFVHPRCVQDRAADLEEVQAMIDAGETEIAVDELRWLLEDCRDFIEAHRLLGELALAGHDVKLARAHFGYAYQIGEAAFPPGGLQGLLPYSVPANQAFLEAAKGLSWCLIQLDQRDKAREILTQLLACDPSDPLGAAEMLRI
jgi:hypothetical protein